RNSLLYTGMSTVTVAAADVVQIERQVTMYRQNAYGESDPSYLDVETIYTLSYLRYSLRTFITQRFPRHKLADNGTPVRPGQNIVTPEIMTLQLIALGEEWVELGLVENLDTFKKNLLVERNTKDRNRLDVMCTPDLHGSVPCVKCAVRLPVQNGFLPPCVAGSGMMAGYGMSIC
ncbi:phage tail sheath C-terminal domain-containing protein, partial [Escherichia coli]